MLELPEWFHKGIDSADSLLELSITSLHSRVVPMEKDLSELDIANDKSGRVFVAIHMLRVECAYISS